MQTLVKRRFRAMGGTAEAQLFARNENDGRALLDAAVEEVRRIERKFSRYTEEGVVARINGSAGKAPLEVDEETAALLDYAAECHRMSEGLFDVTSGVLRRAWNFQEKRVPAEEELRRLLPLIGWEKVEWRRPFLTLPREGMEIDFGGIGKEYAADAAAALLTRLGVSSGLVNLAGDISVAGGPRPDGRPWELGVVHPRRPGSTIAALPLVRGGVATSGDYERCFQKDGRRYSHILNPRTGWPAEGWQSVTVAAPRCLVAGSMSTIAMLLGRVEGERFLRSGGLPFLAIDGGGARIGSKAPSPALRAP